jgi:hypothetical protein
MRKITAVIASVSITFALTGCVKLTEEEGCAAYTKAARSWLGSVVAGDEGNLTFLNKLGELASQTEGDLKLALENDIESLKSNQPGVEAAVLCGINSLTALK